MKIDQFKRIIYYLENCRDLNGRRKDALEEIKEFVSDNLQVLHAPGLPGEFFRAIEDSSCEILRITGVADAEDDFGEGILMNEVTLGIESNGFEYALRVTLHNIDGNGAAYLPQSDTGLSCIELTKLKDGEELCCDDIPTQTLALEIGSFAEAVYHSCAGEEIIPAGDTQLSVDQWIALQSVLDPATPVLNTAVSNGALDLVRSLIAHGIECNEVDSNGNNALHVCLNSSSFQVSYRAAVELIETLLDAGVDPERKNKDGRTPMDIIKTSSSDAIKKDIYPLLESCALKSKNRNAEAQESHSLGL